MRYRSQSLFSLLVNRTRKNLLGVERQPSTLASTAPDNPKSRLAFVIWRTWKHQERPIIASTTVNLSKAIQQHVYYLSWYILFDCFPGIEWHPISENENKQKKAWPTATSFNQRRVERNHYNTINTTKLRLCCRIGFFFKTWFRLLLNWPVVLGRNELPSAGWGQNSSQVSRNRFPIFSFSWIQCYASIVLSITREIWSVESWERANSLEVKIIRHLYHHLSIHIGRKRRLPKWWDRPWKQPQNKYAVKT